MRSEDADVITSLLNLEPTAVVGQFLMQVFTPEMVERCSVLPIVAPQVLGTSLVLDLDDFPELNWLLTYLTTRAALQSEHDRLTHAIAALAADGEVYRDYWIEPYTKTKNGQQYTYHQLRWLTGERKQSGQPRVKTKHLSHRAVGEVRAAITRGHQAETLEQQRQQMEADLSRLKQLVQGTGRRLQRLSSLNPMTNRPDYPLSQERSNDEP